MKSNLFLKTIIRYLRHRIAVSKSEQAKCVMMMWMRDGVISSGNTSYLQDVICLLYFYFVLIILNAFIVYLSNVPGAGIICQWSIMFLVSFGTSVWLSSAAQLMNLCVHLIMKQWQWPILCTCWFYRYSVEFQDSLEFQLVFLFYLFANYLNKSNQLIWFKLKFI